MADEQPQAPVEEQDTPTAPQEGDAATESVDWEKRYNDLRPEYDRVKTEWSQREEDLALLEAIQSDPDTQRQLYEELAQAYGTDAEDVEEPLDETGLDPAILSKLQELDEKSARYEQHLQKQEEDELVQQMDEFITDSLEKLSDGQELSDDEETWIVSRAVSLPPTADGLPDVQQAYEEYKKLDAARHERYSKTKRAPQAPQGQGATKDPDLDNPREREDYFAAKFTANES